MREVRLHFECTDVFGLTQYEQEAQQIFWIVGILLLLLFFIFVTFFLPDLRLLFESKRRFFKSDLQVWDKPEVWSVRLEN